MSTLRNPVLYPAELRGRSSTFYSLPKMISRFQMRRLLRSEEHTSELQSRPHLVCRLLLEKKKKKDGVETWWSMRVQTLRSKWKDKSSNHSQSNRRNMRLQRPQNAVRNLLLGTSVECTL